MLFSNLYDFISSVEHKLRYSEVCFSRWWQLKTEFSIFGELSLKIAYPQTNGKEWRAD